MSNAATTAPINPREQRTIREHPVLHLRGPLLVGPQQEIDEAWVVGGRLHHLRPELPAGTELLEIDGFVVPGLADLHCHLGIKIGEHTSELQSRGHLVWRLLLERKTSQRILLSN